MIWIEYYKKARIAVTVMTIGFLLELTAFELFPVKEELFMGIVTTIYITGLTAVFLIGELYHE